MEVAINGKKKGGLKMGKLELLYKREMLQVPRRVDDLKFTKWGSPV